MPAISCDASLLTADVVEGGLDDMGRDAKLGHAGSSKTLAIMQSAR